MISLRHYPLNGLNTLEDELLFLLAGSIKHIYGMKSNSIISKDKFEYCAIFLENSPPAHEVSTTAICYILKKYNKSFTGHFLIKLIKDEVGRYSINIEENLNYIPKEVRWLNV